MAKEIRARFTNGVFAPLEPVNLKEGEEVKVIIPERPTGKGMIEALRASAGSWQGHMDAEELIRNIYADRLINTRPVPKLDPPSDEAPQHRAGGIYDKLLKY
jgi:predicted DNA-binding antitoxin AbrB/MazE fold protein